MKEPKNADQETIPERRMHAGALAHTLRLNAE
jgi:hypothetical protein